jgi:hypothetical protein
VFNAKFITKIICWSLGLIVSALSCTQFKKVAFKAEKNIPFSGSEFYRIAASFSVNQRDSLCIAAAVNGNIPAFFQKFVPIKTRLQDKNGLFHQIKFYVSPDYLMIGSDKDYARIPVSPFTAQVLADKMNCFLPTAPIVDQIYRHSKIKLAPLPMFAFRDSTPTFWQHHLMIEGQLRNKGKGLVAGIKKDLIICSEKYFKGKTNRVAIYGWHKLDGKPIQPIYTGHIDSYVDYSHGARFIYRIIEVDGKKYDYEDLLLDPTFKYLLTNDDAPTITKYPYSLQSLE